jgi:membrane protease YdiL (CAAX protease family)
LAADKDVPRDGDPEFLRIELLKTFWQTLKSQSATASIWEISVVVGCVLISEWVIPILFGMNWYAGAIPAFIAVIFIVLSQTAKGETLRKQSWRIDNFFKAGLLLVLPMLFGTAVLVTIGWFFGGLKKSFVPFDLSLIWGSIGLFVWALTQQYPLQAFINRRAQSIWGAGTASVIFTAGIFALLHFPNPWLMAATLFGGLMWAYVYQREPNLWVLALSHALMTVILAMTAPYPALHGLRVGYNYF